jgi:hypothetical protein
MAVDRVAPGSTVAIPPSSSLASSPTITRLANVIAPPDAPNQVPSLSMRMGVIQYVDYITGLVDLTIGGASGDELVVGVKHLSNYRPVAGDTVWLFQSGNDAVVIDRNAIFGPSAITDSAGDWITKEETTTSTSYTNLATVGPSFTNVPVSPSGKLMIIIGAAISNDAAGGAAMGYQLVQTLAAPGVTPLTVAPALQYGVFVNKIGAGKVMAYTHCHIRALLPVGMYSITAKYAAYTSGTARFNNRTLSVIPL